MAMSHKNEERKREGNIFEKQQTREIEKNELAPNSGASAAADATKLLSGRPSISVQPKVGQFGPNQENNSKKVGAIRGVPSFIHQKIA